MIFFPLNLKADQRLSFLKTFSGSTRNIKFEVSNVHWQLNLVSLKISLNFFSSIPCYFEAAQKLHCWGSSGLSIKGLHGFQLSEIFLRVPSTSKWEKKWVNLCSPLFDIISNQPWTIQYRTVINWRGVEIEETQRNIAKNGELMN